jgi:hypothetical protein
MVTVDPYNPAVGRFLSTDPTLGGNANSFDYCSGNAIGCSDLSGKNSHVHHKWSRWHTHLTIWLDHYYSARFADSLWLGTAVVDLVAVLAGVPELAAMLTVYVLWH